MGRPHPLHALPCSGATIPQLRQIVTEGAGGGGATWARYGAWVLTRRGYDEARAAAVILWPGPMKFFDAGSEARGFIAVGQIATGFIAIGQMATGVIAIGQLARGVIAIGQLGIGFIGWGQGGVGIFHAAGMLGVGGRRGIGGVVQLVPTIGRPRLPPEPTHLQAVASGLPGWVELDLARDALGLGLYDRGQRAPIKLDRRVLTGGIRITEEGPVRVWAFTRRVGPTFVCERIVHVPPRPYQKKSFLPLAIVQVLALFVLGAVYWPAVGNDLVDFFAKAVAEAAPSPAPKPAATLRPPVPYTPPKR